MNWGIGFAQRPLLLETKHNNTHTQTLAPDMFVVNPEKSETNIDRAEQNYGSRPILTPEKHMKNRF